MVIDERTGEDAGGNPYSNDDGKICAGDRAPDAPGLIDLPGQRTKLFNIFKPWLHTVLIFGNNLASPVLRALGRYPNGAIQTFCIVPKGTFLPAPLQMVLEDRDGHAYTGYAVDRARDTVIVVRPDGVIGAIGFGVEGIEQYFDWIFEV